MIEDYNLNWCGDYSTTTRASNTKHHNFHDSGMNSFVSVMRAGSNLRTKDGPAICPMTFKGTRSKKNAQNGSILLYDMDNWFADVSPKVLEDRIRTPFVTYETFSSTLYNPRLRIIAFLPEKIKPYEYETYWHHYAKNIQDLGLDTKTSDCTRLGFTLRKDATLDFHIPYNPWEGFEKLIIPKPIKAIDEPVIELGGLNDTWLSVLRSIGSYPKGQQLIVDDMTFKTRSEFVFFIAKVCIQRQFSKHEFLDLCSSISSDFRADPKRWLSNIYDVAKRGLNRANLMTAFEFIKSSMKTSNPIVPIGTQTEILLLFLRIGYQLDELSFFRSCKDIHADLEKDTKTLTAIHKSLNKLENKGLIEISRGVQYSKDVPGGVANTYNLKPLIDKVVSSNNSQVHTKGVYIN